MNDSSSTDKSISSDQADILTHEATARVKTISDLWILARIVKDIEGDPVWEVLDRLGYRPAPSGDIGYNFDYNGFKGIYIPAKRRSGLISFMIPKLADVSGRSRVKVNEILNLANSLVTESKFTVIGSEVWLVHERYLAENEDYESIVGHILENLRCGAEIFFDLYKF